MLTVIARLEGMTDTEHAIDELTRRGFDRSAISIVAPVSKSDVDIADPGSSAAEGQGIGGNLGGLIGLLVGTGALAIPGIGPTLSAGPFAALLGSATSDASGSAGNALQNALAGIGVPENDAEFYTEAVQQGAALVMVHTSPDRAQEGAEILLQANGQLPGGPYTPNKP
jgi:hypothetical protein